MQLHTLLHLERAHGLDLPRPWTQWASTALVTACERAAGAVARKRASVRKKRELEAMRALPDHLLRDMGITRAEFELSNPVTRRGSTGS